MLYRGINISNKEYEKLIKFYEYRTINKKEIESWYLIYSRGFLSFSQKENISKNFIGTIKVTKKILFRLNNMVGMKN